MTNQQNKKQILNNLITNLEREKKNNMIKYIDLQIENEGIVESIKILQEILDEILLNEESYSL